MKQILFILLCLKTIALIAQQSEIKGIVSIHNSKFETGKTEYVSNAQVEDDFKKANATTTTADGRFKLVFVGIKNNEKVSFNVKKEKMEVVNTEALYAVAGQKEQVAIFMAPEGKIAENKLKYYNINREAAEKALTTKLKDIGDEILKLKQNEMANAGQIGKLQAEYNALQIQYEKIEQSARELAERYAKINLDDQTKEYQSAFRYFQKGQLEEALKILNQVDLEKTGNAIVQEQLRQRKLDKEWIERDSIKNEKKQQVKAGLSFKAQLHNTQFEFNKAQETYLLLLRLDSTDVNAVWLFAEFLERQNKKDQAIYYFEKALVLAKTPELKAAFQNNLGYLYRENLKMPQAKAALNEALTIARQLAQNNPDAFLPDVAMTLNNLGTHYSINQKMPQAEAAYKEALEINRYLAQKKPDEFLPELAKTLDNLGNYYIENQQMSQSENVFTEALTIKRQLAQKKPDEFLPSMAVTLNNLGNFYVENEKMPQAETAYLEALTIFRQLALKNPDAYLPGVAMTLINLGSYYFDNEEIPEVRIAYDEALKIYRQLVQKNPDAFLPNLVTTLNNLGIFYRDIEKLMPQAETAFNEALMIGRQLVQKNPDAFLPYVATTLNSLGALFYDLKNYKAALVHYGEALRIREASILNGEIHQYLEWERALINISNVRDLLKPSQNYQNLCLAIRFMAESCDSLIKVNSNLKSISVYEYGNLSWSALLAKDYALSEKSALRCLELDHTQEWVFTNLGHSQLLRGQYSAAKATYEKLKGKKDSEGKAYKQVLLDDLNALEAEGISHKDFAQARAAIEKW